MKYVFVLLKCLEGHHKDNDLNLHCKCFCMGTLVNLLKDCCLIVQRRFVNPNDLESYAGGSINS
jgi:hypothetical protein